MRGIIEEENEKGIGGGGVGLSCTSRLNLITMCHSHGDIFGFDLGKRYRAGTVECKDTFLFLFLRQMKDVAVVDHMKETP